MQQQQRVESSIVEGSPVVGSRPRSGYRLRTMLEAYAFLLPSFVGLLAFVLLPVVAVFVLRFFKWFLITQPHFIGLGNYATMLSSIDVWQSLLTTVFYVLLNIPAQTVLAILLALLMNKKLPGIGFLLPRDPG